MFESVLLCNTLEEVFLDLLFVNARGFLKLALIIFLRMLKFLGLGPRELSLDDLILELEVDFNLFGFQCRILCPTEVEGRGWKFGDWDDL